MPAAYGIVLGLTAAGLAFASATASFADANDKVLVNLRGDVTYVVYSSGQPRSLSPAASIDLEDDDVARTGNASMGAIVLANSSRVILASDTTVKLDVFDDVAATAHFVVFDGKLRFRVEHPAGANATYTFTTATGSVAVRGTEGDISSDSLDGVRVNVYHLTDQHLPVVVETLDGQRFDLSGGQKIWMRWERGRLVARVQPLTRAEVDRFRELGAPTTIDGGPPAQ
ncbi:MAG: FecR domain-containing protein [Candidatus Eremiobacteraeota bacterium]|nr:FecR domain-containing protein [Candidatus Eremiobacteraeota bacterium]MBV8371645.1 FecR domain-containing protein [Candidatus Eremiobacteraeota bacterium]